MSRPLPRHWIMLSLLAVIYGSAFLLNRLALTALSPATLVLGRLTIGFILLVPVSIILRRPAPRARRIWKDLTILAFLGYALPFGLIAWGQQDVPSGIAGILMAVMPILIIGLAHFFIPEEPLTRGSLAGFLLALAGTIALIGPDALASFGGDAKMLLHELAVLGGAVAYSASAVFTRRAPPFDPIAGSAALLFLAALMTLPLAPHALHEIGAAPWPALLSVVLLGIFPTGAATIIYVVLIREAGAGFYAIVNYLVPVWAAFLGASLGMETLPPTALAGLALILGGVAIAQLKTTRKPRDSSAEIAARDL